ncbi:TadE family protein [Actinoallomurus sp. NPDC050550]|uniref:TadE family protein n=1 Tax=Actinoallomurus sp. NPDC050550 TaxID=3154937 RepID=UPI0033DA8ACC
MSTHVTTTPRPRSTTGTAEASRGDAGTMSLELVLLTPILVAFMMLMVGLGRIVEAQSQVDGAARDAARAASVARDRGSARVDADNAAKATMSGNKWCQGGPQVDPDFRDWRQGGQVSVTVRCDIDLGGLSLIGLSASKTMVGTATAPLDTLRRID